MSGHIEKVKKGDKVFYSIIFKKTPIGVMRDLRSLLKSTGGRVRRNSMGGITIVPDNPCCPEITSDLALSINEIIPRLTVDVRTIPILPPVFSKF